MRTREYGCLIAKNARDERKKSTIAQDLQESAVVEKYLRFSPYQIEQAKMRSAELMIRKTN